MMDCILLIKEKCTFQKMSVPHKILPNLMRTLLPIFLFSVLLFGCETSLEAPPDDDIRAIRYEVNGQAPRAIIEYIGADGRAVGVGVEEVPWALEFDVPVGERLYLSAWSSETGGGAIEIRVLVDGKVFRTAKNGTGVRPRISGNAY